MTRVSISILNYNSTQSTIACVQSLLLGLQKDDDEYELEIFVVDNDSDSEEQLQLQQSLAELPHTRLQVNKKNRGFSAGHNKNLRAIFLASSPDYIWLLNNDCLVYDKTLTSLIKCAQEHPDIGIWGATLLESDGEKIQCAGGCLYNPWISSYRQNAHGKALADIGHLKTVDFDYVAGASLFIPAKTLQIGLHPISEVGQKNGLNNQQWLNERFFLYFEELDLAQRLRPGFGMGWCKEALIVHAGGTSTGSNANRRTKLAEYHSTLSALIFTRIYYPGRLWIMAPARFLSKCIQLVFQGKFRLFASLFKAYLDFFRRK